jgi:hypothetical protein
MENWELLSAHFTDNEKLTIEAVYNDKSNDEDPFAIFIEAREDDGEYQNLLKHISVDQLHENTALYIREARQGFETLVKELAEFEGLSVKELQQDDVFDLLIETASSDVDDETLFKFKLKVFDVQAVKDCEDRSIKAEIRKAKSIAEVIGAFAKV